MARDLIGQQNVLLQELTAALARATQAAAAANDPSRFDQQVRPLRRALSVFWSAVLPSSAPAFPFSLLHSHLLHFNLLCCCLDV